MNQTKDNIDTEQTGSPWIIAGAIVVAGLLVAAGIFFGMNTNSDSQAAAQADQTDTQADQQAQAQQQRARQEAALEEMTPVSVEDHIRGDRDAEVKIVEYSDFECPFCNRFHDTMKQVVDNYANDEVAWVFRHFPIDQLHPKNARKVAVISECVADLSSQEDAFWTFSDGYFANSPANDQTNLEEVLPMLYGEVGVSEEAVNECVDSGRFDDAVQSEVENAQASGGRGTPWSILVGPDGEKFPINGAQPYQAVKQLIDSQLQ